MKIDPDEYQPETKNTYDFNFTPDEKRALAFYLFLIALGLALLLGLVKSGDIVSHEQAIHNLSNLSNETVYNLTGRV